MKTAEHYRLLMEKKQGVASHRQTWGDIWKIQEDVIRMAMRDVQEECAMIAYPVDETLAEVIRKIEIK